MSPEDRAIALFHDAAANVPAYAAFLREQGVDPAGVLTIEEFRRVPAVTKENYVLRHPLPALCRGGTLEACDMLAASSGSTGRPTFWPRSLADEAPTARRFESIFRDSFQAHERRTLAVVCFALGAWVGGLYTLSCVRGLAAKGYPITCIAPGNNRDEILRAVTELAPLFDQTVLLGYPPFLKDVIDAGRARGVKWEDYGIRLVMAGEVFSEEWRDLVGERTGSKRPCFDSASLYGTADAGVLASETPLSIAIRRWLSRHPEAAREVFGEARLPTLAQYDPMDRYFEMEDGRLLFTGDNGAPLIRYNILDSGGIIPNEDMLAFLTAKGFDPFDELASPSPVLGRGSQGVRGLPFVFVFGRSHFAVSFYGANVYPENVMVGLEQPGISNQVTGKFVLEVREDEDRSSVLAVAVELAPGVEAPGVNAGEIAASIRAHLERLNSEFANYVPPERRTPHVTLHPAGEPAWFPTGVKHRYTRR